MRWLAALATVLVGAVLLVSCKQLPPTTFAAPVNVSVGSFPSTFELADVTGDDIVDLVGARQAELVLRPGVGDGSFGDPIAYPFSEYGFADSVDIGDLDNDGLADVVATNDDRVERWEESSGALVATTDLVLDANEAAIDDVTGDGLDDLLVLGWSNDVLTVYPQLPTGGLGAAQPHAVQADGYNDLDTGDIDGDGDNDVLVTSGQGQAPNVTVLLQQPDGTLAVRGSWSLAADVLTKGAAIGDVDKDAWAEIIVSHGGNGDAAKVTVLEADETGGLVEGTTYGVTDIPVPVEAADINGDGYDDALVKHSGWNTLSVLYGSYNGLTTPVQEITAGQGTTWDPDAIQAVDVDADGDLDVGFMTNNAGFTLLQNTGVPEATTTTSSTSTSTSTTSTSTTSTSTSTTLPVPADDVVQIVTGAYFTCGLMGDGTVRCWGDNSSGQLGDGTMTSSSTPVAVEGIDSAVSISAGFAHACALLGDGTVSCWGDNPSGQLGAGTGPDQATPVAVTGIDNATGIATGYRHSCALLDSGTASCWGWNVDGQLGNDSTTSSPTPVAVIGLSGAAQLTGGNTHTCALLVDGSVKCWGGNSSGQLGDDSTDDRDTPVAVAGLSNATAIATSWAHTCALLDDGGAACWGANWDGQIGDGTTTDHTTPYTLPGLTGLLAIGGGAEHSCAVVADGGARCWGGNTHGQLGDGTTTPHLTPGMVNSLPTSDQLALSPRYHSCARTTEGGAVCWGDNSSGQLGDGTFTERTTPVAVIDLG